MRTNDVSTGIADFFLGGNLRTGRDRKHFSVNGKHQLKEDSSNRTHDEHKGRGQNDDMKQWRGTMLGVPSQWEEGRIQGSNRPRTALHFGGYTTAVPA